MVRPLRALAALLEDPSSAPSTLTRWVTAPSPGGSQLQGTQHSLPLSPGTHTRACSHTCMHTCTQLKMKMKIKSMFKRKEKKNQGRALVQQKFSRGCFTKHCIFRDETFTSVRNLDSKHPLQRKVSPAHC